MRGPAYRFGETTVPPCESVRGDAEGGGGLKPSYIDSGGGRPPGMIKEKFYEEDSAHRPRPRTARRARRRRRERLGQEQQQAARPEGRRPEHRPALAHHRRARAG